jgi:hypothetical protein
MYKTLIDLLLFWYLVSNVSPQMQHVFKNIMVCSQSAPVVSPGSSLPPGVMVCFCLGFVVFCIDQGLDCELAHEPAGRALYQAIQEYLMEEQPVCVATLN